MRNYLTQATEPFTGDEVVAGIVTIKGAERVFANVVTVILGFAGIALFIMLIVGGLKYITSGGNPKNTEAAGKTITYAITGIALIALSYLILSFIKYITGADVTTFRITPP